MGSIMSAISDDIEAYESLCAEFGETVQYTVSPRLPNCYGEHATRLREKAKMKRSSTYGRRTDDGTYPNVEEERAKMEERAAAATVSETSTTWEHGHVKCIMRTETRGGATTRTVKVIDMRPRPKQHGMQPNTQWEGTFEEFLQYTSSLDKLFPLLTAKRHENDRDNTHDSIGRE